MVSGTKIGLKTSSVRSQWDMALIALVLPQWQSFFPLLRLKACDHLFLSGLENIFRTF
jgi:hypothetical protein